jgi:hypothetical protein
MKVFSKRNAIIGWLVYKVAKRKARKAAPGKRGGAIAGGVAGLGALLAGLMFWRKRRSDEGASSS